MNLNKKGEKLKNLLRDDRVLFLISLLFAAVLWLIVVGEVDPNTRQTIYNVPVEIDTKGSILTNLDLSPILDEPLTVDIVVEGERYIVSSLTASDIKVEADLSGAIAAGPVDLRLIATSLSNKQFVIESVNPSVLKVNFDKLVTQKFELEAVVANYTFPIGYEALDEVVQPAEITVEGPETEIVNIHRAVAYYNLDKSVTSTQKLVAEIIFYDAQGEELPTSHFNYEVKTAEITLGILKRKVLPLTIDFIGVDENFAYDELVYSIEPRIVEIAGPEDLVDSLENINIGYLDIEDLDIFGEYNFSYTLPNGCVMISDVETSAKIVFNSKNYSSAEFMVTNIRLVNVPDDVKATVMSQNVQNVKIIGPKSVIESLKASDIVAEVDLSGRVISSYGQIKVPVNIIIPGAELTWAYGSYQVQLAVQEK